MSVVRQADSSRIEKTNSLPKIDSGKELAVRYGDIDTNRHVNNAGYADCSIESVPMDIVLKHELKRIKTTNKKETRCGENIKVLSGIITAYIKLQVGMEANCVLLKRYGRRAKGQKGL